MPRGPTPQQGNPAAEAESIVVTVSHDLLMVSALFNGERKLVCRIRSEHLTVIDLRSAAVGSIENKLTP